MGSIIKASDVTTPPLDLSTQDTDNVENSAPSCMGETIPTQKCISVLINNPSEEKCISVSSRYKTEDDEEVCADKLPVITSACSGSNVTYPTLNLIDSGQGYNDNNKALIGYTVRIEIIDYDPNKTYLFSVSSPTSPTVGQLDGAILSWVEPTPIGNTVARTVSVSETDGACTLTTKYWITPSTEAWQGSIWSYKLSSGGTHIGKGYVFQDGHTTFNFAQYHNYRDVFEDVVEVNLLYLGETITSLANGLGLGYYALEINNYADLSNVIDYSFFMSNYTTAQGTPLPVRKIHGWKIHSGNMSQMFYRTEYLTDIGDFQVIGKEGHTSSMSNTFNLSGVESVDSDTLLLNGVTSMSYAFASTKLSGEITLNAPDLISGSGLFFGTQITKVIMNAGENGSITNTEGMFGYMSELEEVTEFNTSNVTRWTGMFFGCKKLNKVNPFNIDSSTFPFEFRRAWDTEWGVLTWENFAHTSKKPNYGFYTNDAGNRGLRVTPSPMFMSGLRIAEVTLDGVVQSKSSYYKVSGTDLKTHDQVGGLHYLSVGVHTMKIRKEMGCVYPFPNDTIVGFHLAPNVTTGQPQTEATGVTYSTSTHYCCDITVTQQGIGTLLTVTFELASVDLLTKYNLPSYYPHSSAGVFPNRGGTVYQEMGTIVTDVIDDTTDVYEYKGIY